MIIKTVAAMATTHISLEHACADVSAYHGLQILQGCIVLHGIPMTLQYR